MAYLNDTEKRLLFSALSREKEICKQVDKECCREPYEDTLESVVKGLEKKFHYNRFEKEIRAKVINEFFEELQKYQDDDMWLRLKMSSIYEIAEQMKGEYEQSESGFVNELIDFLEENIHAEKQIAEDGGSREEVVAHMYAARQFDTLKGWIESRAKKSNQDWKDSMLNKFDGREV